ncbi:DUF2946 domain-containing protein [Undibacterium sp.]|uniref:DUF2946 domain-containing protein n=1 Tax=Undibacterium sp. TaxID=1914977 RepID=UPI00374DA72D
MKMKSIHRSFVALLACFAVLAASLMPSISSAMMRSNADDITWGQICSASPAIAAVVAKADTSSLSKSQLPVKKSMHGEHCLFCFTHAGSFALLPTVNFEFPAVDQVQLFPSLFYQSPNPLFIWASAQSRAPPLRA